MFKSNFCAIVVGNNIEILANGEGL